jgi:riboflavin synthase
MFTGLVQAVGSVGEIVRGADSAVFRFDVQGFLDDVKLGDSIAVNGVCLTVVELAENFFTADVMVQTLKLSSLGSLETGSLVNLELAAKVSDRLGGHIVQGHVDGVGTITAITPGEKWQRVDISIPAPLMKYLQPQGSVTVDGTSLTVGELDDAANSIAVWLIPETLKKTNLHARKVGDAVNIEVDVLAKYVERLLKRGSEGAQ